MSKYSRLITALTVLEEAMANGSDAYLSARQALTGGLSANPAQNKAVFSLDKEYVISLRDAFQALAHALNVLYERYPETYYRLTSVDPVDAVVIMPNMIRTVLGSSIVPGSLVKNSMFGELAPTLSLVDVWLPTVQQLLALAIDYDEH